MLNKLLHFIRKNQMVQEGDTVICAVSGGADSVALLWAVYLLRDKLKIRVEAVHFNHNLRGDESDRDEAFVAQLCDRYDIPLHIGRKNVVAGEKGLEAAARNARYEFFGQLSGKIATAHTADDNAETVLMHLIRGTGLKGLGGITPVRGHLIRPMLTVTREDVLAFLQEYHLTYVDDSSNDTDAFLRNRIRHHLMPLLRQENPSIATSLTQTALRLRRDEAELEKQASGARTANVQSLRNLPDPIRSRILADLLTQYGVPEPNGSHIELLEQIVFSNNPSAKAAFPGNVTIGRCYDELKQLDKSTEFSFLLPVPGELELKALGLKVVVTQGTDPSADFTFSPCGTVVVRSRKSGDNMRLIGGTRTLKKLFIDRKIPANDRNHIPVVADDAGVIGVYGIGMNLDRQTDSKDRISIRFEIPETI